MAYRDFHIGGRTRAGRVFVFTKTHTGSGAIRYLTVGRSVQSGIYVGEHYPELAFEYMRGFDRILCARKEQGVPVQAALLLGGGGFSFPAYSLRAHSALTLDVVEPEAAILAAAERWFFLNELTSFAGDRLHVHQMLADEYLASTAKRYDLIINDAFSGADPAFTSDDPHEIELIKAHLVPGGAYVVNVVVHGDEAPLLATIAALEKHFSQVKLIYATDEMLSDDDNYLVIAHTNESLPIKQLH